MSIIDDFKARFPEFDESDVDARLPALSETYSCYWGGSYDTSCGQEIVLNLLAHLLTVELTSGSDGPRRAGSKSVGSVSVSYDNGPADTSNRASWYRTTKYGMKYLILIDSRQGGFFV